MEQKKKMTNAQLLRRIQRSPLHLDLTKSTISVYFSDKGLRLTVDDHEGYALIATGFHTHYFQQWTTSGYSRPFLYTKRIVEIANAHLEECKTENGYSFTRLIEFLKTKEDRTEYNICMYVDWWLFNLFQPLYAIGETEAEQFLVYESYIHNIARNSILLSEKTEGMTNKQFFDNIIEQMKEMAADMDERVLFEKKTDEEVAKENIEAATEMELNETVEEQNNG